jgi:hypothetical protein
MAKVVKYKRPSRINPVSVGLVIAALLVGYLAYQYLPLFLLRQDVYRVLDEVSSEYCVQSDRLRKSPEDLQRMTEKLSRELRRVGVRDPNMEHWIEPHGEHEVALGVLYSDVVEWAIEAIPSHERIVEIELVCTRLQKGSAWTCKPTTGDAGQR